MQMFSKLSYKTHTQGIPLAAATQPHPTHYQAAIVPMFSIDCFPHFPHFHCIRCSKSTQSALVLLCQAWFFASSPGNSADLIALCLQGGLCIALFFFHLNLLVPSTGSNPTILQDQTSFSFLPQQESVCLFMKVPHSFRGLHKQEEFRSTLPGWAEIKPSFPLTI